MNSRIALSSLLLATAFAGSAFAETPTIASDSFTSTRTRAEVQAELASYRQAGVNPWATSYNPVRSFQGTLTREAVVADYLASRNEVRALNGEDSGSAWLAHAHPVSAPSSTLAGTPFNAQ